jgi:hypothetical protein
MDLSCKIAGRDINEFLIEPLPGKEIKSRLIDDVMGDRNRPWQISYCLLPIERIRRLRTPAFQ